jgi:methylglutaconyl-CoA hydratase
MISIEHDKGSFIATVTLNRPEIRNALDRRMVRELTSVFRRMSTDDSVRVIILTGEGQTFSAGADLKALAELRDASTDENAADSQALANLFESIRMCLKPVIARVNGHAIAGGFGLVTVCDFAVADQRARFGFTEVRIGFVPAIVMTYVRQRLGDLHLRDLMMRGHLISASEAQDMNLINTCVDGARLDKSVLGLAHELVRETSADAVAATKLLIHDMAQLGQSERLSRGVLVNTTMRASPECLAGVDAFLKKEDPPWKQMFDSRASDTDQD